MKTITFIIGFLILLATLIGATAQPPMPAPLAVYITLNGEPAPNGILIEILNKETNELLTANEIPTLQVEKGVAMVDLSEFELGYFLKNRNYPGDEVEITCSLRDCKKTIFLDSPPIEVNIEVIDEDYIPVEEKYVCWDDSIVTDKADCPALPEPKYICPDGSEVEKAEDCPEETNALTLILGILSGLLVVAVAVLAKFNWGKGFVGLVKYYIKKGDEAKKKGNTKEALKNYSRAVKMVGTAIKKAKEDKYKR